MMLWRWHGVAATTTSTVLREAVYGGRLEKILEVAEPQSSSPRSFGGHESSDKPGDCQKL